MDVDIRELAWAAGLFEGEGCITRSAARGHKYPALKLNMTDEDSVRRFHSAVGGAGTCYGPRSNGPGNKDFWCWTAYRFEHVQAVIVYLWYGLGKRRRARATEVLSDASYLYTEAACIKGHPRTEENKMHRGNGKTECLLCARERSFKNNRSRRAAAKAAV